MKREHISLPALQFAATAFFISACKAVPVEQSQASEVVARDAKNLVDWRGIVHGLARGPAGALTEPNTPVTTPIPIVNTDPNQGQAPPQGPDQPVNQEATQNTDEVTNQDGTQIQNQNVNQDTTPPPDDNVVQETTQTSDQGAPAAPAPAPGILTGGFGGEGAAGGASSGGG